MKITCTDSAKTKTTETGMETEVEGPCLGVTYTHASKLFSNTDGRLLRRDGSAQHKKIGGSPRLQAGEV